MVDKAHYDPPKMREGASALRNELKNNYLVAKQDMDGIVEILVNNWDDDNNRAYCDKYEKEAKVAAESVQMLMEEYAKVLEGSADDKEVLDRITAADIEG